MTALVQEVLDDIPIEYRERFEAVSAGPLGTHGDALIAIKRYVSMVRQVAPMVTALDPELADQLGRVCTELVGRFDSGEQGELALAATRYFVEEDDDDEITGVLGFDDDVQVLNAVCRVLGASDLVVPLR